jgi:hypothetical protein
MTPLRNSRQRRQTVNLSRLVDVRAREQVGRTPLYAEHGQTVSLVNGGYPAGMASDTGALWSDG